MISVLIPTYNYKCFTLVSDVKHQFDNVKCKYEILVAEDGGKDQIVAIDNKRINELEHCRYIRRTENVGRARIRNFLVSESQGEWLLLLDSDAMVVKKDFIEKYIRAINENPTIDVFSGDLVNPQSLPSPDATLRYRYEKAAEPYRTVGERNKSQFRRFNIFNVMIRRDALIEIPFDVKCKEYGYEDTLMGMELENQGKHIMHIDNPLMHMGFDSNDIYLGKVETSLRTLKQLGDKMLPYTGYGKAIDRLKSFHSLLLFELSYKVLKPLLRKNLLGGNPNLRVFGFYKLGYFLSLR